jgi:hypothetical protein
MQIGRYLATQFLIRRTSRRARRRRRRDLREVRYSKPLFVPQRSERRPFGLGHRLEQVYDHRNLGDCQFRPQNLLPLRQQRGVQKRCHDLRERQSEEQYCGNLAMQAGGRQPAEQASQVVETSGVKM